MNEQMRGAAERILMIALEHKSPATYEERVAAIAAELRDLCAWQPIETAPETSGHGLHVLVYVPRYALGSLIVEAWVNLAHPGAPWVAHNGGQIEPTHWMPLPLSPSAAPQEQGKA